MQFGVRLGIDVGKARIGVAKSDPSGMLASPYSTVKRELDSDAHVAELIAIAAEFEAISIYVGNPINLKGIATESTRDALELAQKLALSHDNVRLIDERLTTVTAQSRLSATGKKVKDSRHVIDQAAAAVLLQQALDIESYSGKNAGELVNSQTD